MTVDSNIQRRRDDAFFEDWSPYRSLGGQPQYEAYDIYRLRTGAPYYHCSLRQRLAVLGGEPGFEIVVPQNIRIEAMLRDLAGVRKYPRAMHREGPLDIWAVPAEEWEALRHLLPHIQNIVNTGIE